MVGMEPDTERMLTLEMLEGKERRGGRVELAEREDEEGTWVLAMLLAARVSICAIACVVFVLARFVAGRLWRVVVCWLVGGSLFF